MTGHHHGVFADLKTRAPVENFSATLTGASLPEIEPLEH
jgi:hypothetical protein